MQKVIRTYTAKTSVSNLQMVEDHIADGWTISNVVPSSGVIDYIMYKKPAKEKKVKLKIKKKNFKNKDSQSIH